MSRRRASPGGRALARRLCATQSVILGYHGVARTPIRQDVSLLQVRPSRFRRQIELLLDAGFQFVTVADLARMGRGGQPPPGYAVVSFDDGMHNNLSIALPILQEYGVRATVYVTIGFLDGVSPWIDPRADSRMLNHDGVRALAGAGWELGAHTMTHPDLSTLDYERCRREMDESRVALEEIGGVPVQTFAYPFGRYGSAALAAAADLGFVAAVTTGRGSWDPLELRRIMIGGADPMAIVHLKLANRYEPLLASPPVAGARRTSKRLRARLQARQQRN